MFIAEPALPTGRDLEVFTAALERLKAELEAMPLPRVLDHTFTLESGHVVEVWIDPYNYFLARPNAQSFLPSGIP